MYTKKLQELLNKIERYVKEHHQHYPSSSQLSRRFNLRFISSGCSRRVFNSLKFPDIVIKIQTSNSKKYSANNSEYRFYHRARKEQRKLLSEPYAISKNYIAMAMEKTPQKRTTKAKVKFFIRKAQILPVSHRWDMESITFFGDVSARCPHNIGTAKSGDLKLFDYATAVTT